MDLGFSCNPKPYMVLYLLLSVHVTSYKLILVHVVLLLLLYHFHHLSPSCLVLYVYLHCLSWHSPTDDRAPDLGVRWLLLRMTRV